MRPEFGGKFFRRRLDSGDKTVRIHGGKVAGAFQQVNDPQCGIPSERAGVCPRHHSSARIVSCAEKRRPPETICQGFHHATTDDSASTRCLALKPVRIPARETPRADDAKSTSAPPKGEVTEYTFDHSKIFPGTVRKYWIYVPKQYDPAKPACLHVNQDGIQNNAPKVFDELIHKKEMPVVIGVFVTPGIVKAASNQATDRFNRSYEYDGLGDNYVRFLLEELLPEVETRKTADGRPIRLSKDGNDRCIAGSSSGAICAFTAAWERAGFVSPRVQLDRHVCRTARGQRVSDAHPQVRAEADPDLPRGRQLGSEHLRR